MTKAEKKFMEKLIRDGEAWAAPAQIPMLRRMEARGLVRITYSWQDNWIRGCRETRVVAGPKVKS